MRWPSEEHDLPGADAAIKVPGDDDGGGGAAGVNGYVPGDLGYVIGEIETGGIDAAAQDHPLAAHVGQFPIQRRDFFLNHLYRHVMVRAFMDHTQFDLIARLVHAHPTPPVVSARPEFDRPAYR